MTAALHPRLEAAFPPEFARFGRTLRGSCPGALPLPELFRPAALAGLAERYAPAFPRNSDRRAVLSMWSQYYLLALVPAAVAAALALRHDLPVAAEAMAVVLAPGGLPDWLCLPHDGAGTRQPCPAARLTPLLRGHIQPLAAAMAQAGLPARVVWSNAAHVLNWALGVVDVPAADGVAVRAALAAPGWADGGANPFAPRAGEAVLARGACCLRDRLGMATCSGCPRRRAMTRKEGRCRNQASP